MANAAPTTGIQYGAIGGRSIPTIPPVTAAVPSATVGTRFIIRQAAVSHSTAASIPVSTRITGRAP